MTGAVKLALALLLVAPQSFAMNNYDDPRVVLSYMDRSLSGERDILRLTTTVVDDAYLVFEIKTRTPEGGTHTDDYLLLEISQGRSHQLLIPIDPELGDTVVDYESELAPSGKSRPLLGSSLGAGSGETAFRARRIPQGVEFRVPLSWIDYREKIAFDAYTIRGRPSAENFDIEEVYDRAGKGQKEQRHVSPITLLNNLCATRK